METPVEMIERVNTRIGTTTVMAPTEVTHPITELATKHNKGKMKLSMLPVQFWIHVRNLKESRAKDSVVLNLARAAHATHKEGFLSHLQRVLSSLRAEHGEIECTTGLAAVMEFGCKKYTRNNWKKGFVYSEMLDAALRHADQYYLPDCESGLKHWQHTLFCVCTLFYMIDHNVGINDLEWVHESKVQKAHEVHSTRPGD